MTKRRRRNKLQFLSLPLSTKVRNFFHFELFINHQQFHSSIGSYAHKSCVTHNFSQPSPKTRQFCTGKGTERKKVPRRLWTNPCLNHFPQSERNCQVDRMVSCCRAKWVLTFPPPLKRFIQKMETRPRVIGARPTFYMISCNPNVSLGITDCSLCTRHNAVKDDF